MNSDLIKLSLWNELRERQHCHVFLDRLVDHYDLDELLNQEDPSLIKQPLLDPIFTDAPQTAPLLLTLGPQHGDWLNRLIDTAFEEACFRVDGARCVCAFIFSDLEPAKLHQRLKQRLRTQVHGLGPVFLRYFDPSVTRALLATLPVESTAWLLQGIDAWFVIDERGQLLQLRPALTTATPSAPLARPAGISMAHWDALELANHVHRATLACRYDGISLGDQTLADIKTLVHQAHRTALTQPADWLTYARLGMQRGGPAAIAADTEVTQAIELASQLQAPLVDVLEQKLGISLAS